MKYTQRLFIPAGVALILASCSLDRSPLDKLSGEVVWSNPDNAEVVLTGIYRGQASYSGPEYTPSDWWTYGGLVFLEFASDNLYDRRKQNSNFFKISSGQLVSNNSFVAAYWNHSYSKIGRCNEFLVNAGELPESAAKNRLIAEARFLRATQYFYLSQYFHDVPLVTTVLTRDEANSVPLTKKKDVVGFVAKELTEAARDLPRHKDIPASEKGRASKQAALAFLGRLLMAEERWNEAADAFKQIIDLGDNELYGSYPDLFLAKGENSTEIIFSFKYLEGLAGNAIMQHAYPAKDGGWCIINVPASLFEAYQFADGSEFSYDSPLYDPADLGKNRDPRLAYTVLYDGALFKGSKYVSHPDSNSPDRVAGGQTTQTGFLLRKFMDEGYSGPLNLYDGDIPVIRYAEVLLSYLECRMEADGTVSRTLLDETINKVRSRPGVGMPPVTETSADRLRPLLRNERRVELAGEGIRYWDILRWKIGDEVLTGDIYGAPFPGSKRTSDKVKGRHDPYGRWYVGSRNFRSPQDYKWPIPQSEQDINPNLRETAQAGK